MMKYLRLICLCFLLLGPVGQANTTPTPHPSGQHESDSWDQDDGNPNHQDGADCTSEECEGEDDPSDEDPGPMPCPPEECGGNSGGARNPGITD